LLAGNLKTKGKLVIGETGSIKGEITCKNTVVEGSVNGKITVSELLTLKATSSLKGDINTRRLAIEPGAKFTGNCNMSMDAVGTTANEPEKSTEGTKKA
jgi:cytoskeletal protein CcmA (bactofilin family)